MVKAFEFARLPKIYFKAGSIEKLPELARTFGSNVIIVTGNQSFAKSDGSQNLLQRFKDKGLKYSIITIPGEPSPEDIDLNTSELSSGKYDCVIAIGGGSVLDAGKAISAMMYLDRPVQDYLESIGSKEHPGTKLPFIAVPTTSGTGSEATKNAVLSRVGSHGFKRSLRHDNFVPDIALIDPELTISCPAHITAASGMDCFTQLTESYLSVKANDYTDALAFEGLRAIRSSLLKSYRDGHDIEARTGMSFAALTSGICLANAGLGVVHGFASSAGGKYKIPHGIICGTLMAVSNEAIVRKLRKNTGNSPALLKYYKLGELFCGLTGGEIDSVVDCFIGYLHNLTDELDLPRLGEAGVNSGELRAIAEETECKNNPVSLDSGELLEILEARF